MKNYKKIIAVNQLETENSVESEHKEIIKIKGVIVKSTA